MYHRLANRSLPICSKMKSIDEGNGTYSKNLCSFRFSLGDGHAQVRRICQWYLQVAVVARLKMVDSLNTGKTTLSQNIIWRRCNEWVLEWRSLPTRNRR
ncbi:MAG: hypothetical protein Ct9H300mP7_4990 [Verrucomicrobiota bacterium]|nr:MAG: hypothetical protein Ct9H300mP7_4990 [Verrucomicrobiota bacterium]